jgi:hypothetical protein
MTSLPVAQALGLPRIRQRRRRMPGKIATIVLLVAVCTTTGLTLIAQGTQHEACVAKHHACDHAAMIARCCCGHSRDASIQGALVESRIQLTVDFSSLPVALAAGTVADTSETSLQVDTLPPSASPDLARQFAPLLI